MTRQLFGIVSVISLTSIVLGFAAQERKPSCGLQLKTIGNAANLYAYDNDNCLPPQLTYSIPKLKVKDGTDQWMANLEKHGAKAEAFRCPDDVRFGKADNQNLYGGFISRKSSYVVSHSYMELEGVLTLVNRPLETIDPEKVAYVEDVVYVVRNPDGTPATASPHGAKMNRWFLDGHVETVPNQRKIFKPLVSE